MQTNLDSYLKKAEKYSFLKKVNTKESAIQTLKRLRDLKRKMNELNNKEQSHDEWFAPRQLAEKNEPLITEEDDIEKFQQRHSTKGSDKIEFGDLQVESDKNQVSPREISSDTLINTSINPANLKLGFQIEAEIEELV